MTNRIEVILKQMAELCLELADEFKHQRENISELEILVHRHETINDNTERVIL